MAAKKDAETLIPTSMKIERGILEKLDYIAWFDRRASRKPVFTEALEAYFAKWEKKNGDITPEKLAEMAKSIS